MGHIDYDDFNEYQYELEMRRLEKEESRLNRIEKSKELQEIYFPLFKKCVDYYFQRMEKSERITLDED